MLNRIVPVAALAAGGILLSQQLKKTQGRGTSGNSSVEESIEVNLPLSTAYNQWTQFEDFPQFKESVHEVRQLDNKRLHWRADVAGKEKQWDAEITEQVPDKRIAWRSVNGVRNNGEVRFEKISDTATRIILKMDYQPEGMVEQRGDALGAVRLEARGNLQRFKELLESRGKESGAWRGSIAQH